MGLFQENRHHKKTGQFRSRSCVTEVNWEKRCSNPLLPLKKQNMRNVFEQMKLTVSSVQENTCSERAMQTVCANAIKVISWLAENILVAFSNRFSFLQTWYRKITLKGCLWDILVCYVFKASIKNPTVYFDTFKNGIRNSCMLSSV